MPTAHFAHATGPDKRACSAPITIQRTCICDFTLPTRQFRALEAQNGQYATGHLRTCLNGTQNVLIMNEYNGNRVNLPPRV